jgi:hypothetical protein
MSPVRNSDHCGKKSSSQQSPFENRRKSVVAIPSTKKLREFFSAGRGSILAYLESVKYRLVCRNQRSFL